MEAGRAESMRISLLLLFRINGGVMVGKEKGPAITHLREMGLKEMIGLSFG